MAARTDRILGQFAILAVVWIAAFVIGVWCWAAWNNIFLMGIVGTVIVVGCWEADRWRRQQREGIRRRRATRGVGSAPTRKSQRALGARRRVTWSAVGSLLVGIGGLLLFWWIVIRLGVALGLDRGYTWGFIPFVGLLGTVGLFFFHARRRRERFDRESTERRRRTKPRIRWPRFSRAQREDRGVRSAGPRRTKPHPARQAWRWAWMDAVALSVVVGTVILAGLILLTSLSWMS